MPLPLENPATMTLRCKDGDIAVITWDYPDCLENIGRLVDVRGPMRVNEAGPSWLIRPITPELYALHESNHVLCREQVTWASGITHPDAWMMPVRPGQEALGALTGEKCSAAAQAQAAATSSV
jgi:hypothetical protein